MMCPYCNEHYIVHRAEVIHGGRYLRVTELTPPPYCPWCGNPIWSEALELEADRVLDEAEMLGRADNGDGEDQVRGGAGWRR